MSAPDAPSPALPTHIRLVASVVRRLPSSWRQTYIRERRAIRRRQRTKAEAAGSRHLSRPALYEMDVQLAALLPDGGTFFEAGGNDGFEQSNTYLLERFHGWKGVLVEPIPHLAAEARRNRPRAQVVEAALVPIDHDGSAIAMRYGGLMSAVAGTLIANEDDESWAKQVSALGLEEPYDVEVPARTLSSILDEAGIVDLDLLSLDIEGFEVAAIAGLDLERHAPRWALVEVRDADAVTAVTAALGDRYVVDRHLSPFDVLYRRTDVPPRTS
ncbi:FkbM family methyltransferase [Patulibacter sp. NPDC049589]|uniref:FkbM family methyltransferase n=1 Tax=Patulibacter sp. NPDC049589 TaxID=3154731 RepID=UPI00341E1B00